GEQIASFLTPLLADVTDAKFLQSSDLIQGDRLEILALLQPPVQILKVVPGPNAGDFDARYVSNGLEALLVVDVDEQIRYGERRSGLGLSSSGFSVEERDVVLLEVSHVRDPLHHCWETSLLPLTHYLRHR